MKIEDIEIGDIFHTVCIEGDILQGTAVTLSGNLYYASGAIFQLNPEPEGMEHPFYYRGVNITDPAGGDLTMEVPTKRDTPVMVDFISGMQQGGTRVALPTYTNFVRNPVTEGYEWHTIGCCIYELLPIRNSKFLEFINWDTNPLEDDSKE